MGDPKRQKKKYKKPYHPWQAARIEEERELNKKYAFKNKQEIWRSVSLLRDFKKQAKNLIASATEQSKKEGKQLLDKLSRLKILPDGSKVEDVLDIDVNTILNRRLQTQVFKKGLARTPSQARQFITHGHIAINNAKVNVPSYLVSTEEEQSINFLSSSSLSKEDHPERITEKKEKTKEVKVKKTKEKTEPIKDLKEENKE